MLGLSWTEDIHLFILHPKREVQICNCPYFHLINLAKKKKEFNAKAQSREDAKENCLNNLSSLIARKVFSFFLSASATLRLCVESLSCLLRG